MHRVFGLEPRQRLCHWEAMAKRTPKAGGFFIMAAILIGFGVGVVRGNVMAGVLAGTAVGTAVALLLWLFDRRRG